MKKILCISMFMFLFVIINGCTIIKIYSGNPPYYTSSTEVFFRADSTSNIAGTLQDSVKVMYNGRMVIIRDGGFDIVGRKIK